jgi:hypothetical protein
MGCVACVCFCFALLMSAFVYPGYLSPPPALGIEKRMDTEDGGKGHGKWIWEQRT